MDALFLSGFSLGIAIVASPGAVTTQAIRRGLDGGFFASFILQLGAVIGLAIWAIVALVGITILAEYVIIQVLLGLAGSGLLLYLAKDALQSTQSLVTLTAESSYEKKNDFMLGTALSLANPLPMLLWMGIANSLLEDISKSQDYGAFLLFFIGFVVSALLWATLLSGLLLFGKRFVSARLFRTINCMSGVILGGFAIKLLWTSWQLLY